MPVNALYMLYHVFSEQKHGQDRFKSIHFSTNRGMFETLSIEDQYIVQQAYPPSHEAALNEALTLFGFRYYEAFRKDDKIVDFDIFNASGEYLGTERSSYQNGVVDMFYGIPKDAGTGKLFILKDKIDVHWRNNQGPDKETPFNISARINQYFKGNAKLQEIPGR